MASPQAKEEFEKKCRRVFDHCNGGDAVSIPELNRCLTETFPHVEWNMVDTFIALDTNKDLKVTWDEFITELTKVRPDQVTKSALESLFEDLDTDGSGVLNRDEYRAALVELGIKHDDDKLDKIFEEVDPDNNGISIKEFTDNFIASLKSDRK